MKVILSSRARYDLEGIRNYIEQDNPTRAISFVDELLDIMKRVAWIKHIQKTRIISKWVWLKQKSLFFAPNCL